MAVGSAPAVKMLSSPVGLLLVVRRLSYHPLPLCGLRPLAGCWLSSNGAERWRFVTLSFAVCYYFSGYLAEVGAERGFGCGSGRWALGRLGINLFPPKR